MSNNKQTRFSLRKGLSSDLPTHAPLGEPLFCTDTGAIYVGMGEGLPIKKVTDPELSEQLEHIATINVLNYSHLCTVTNGVTDWTNAFQQAFNDLPNCGTLIIPNVEYYVSKAILENKNSIIIQCDGVIKNVPNLQPSYGTIFVKNCSNSQFIGLKFNGNKDNVLDNNEAGVDCVLAIENLLNCDFINLNMENTIWSACCSSGNCSNITFRNVNFNNIGEHVFYMSGEGNVNIDWNNIKGSNIGVHPNCPHNGNVVKGRMVKDKTILHDNWKLNEIYLEQTTQVNYNPFICWVYDVKNVVIKKSENKGNCYFIVVGKNSEKIEIKDCNINNVCVWNISPEVKKLPIIKIKNSTITGYEPCLNLITEFDNCIINMTNNFTDKVVSLKSLEKTTINNTTFYTGENKIWWKNFNQDLIFNNCNFIKNDNLINNADIFIRIGETSADNTKTLEFNNCNLDINYAGSVGFYKPIKLKITNCYFNNYLRCYNDTTLTDVHINNLKSSKNETVKLDTYLKSEKWTIGDVVNTVRGNVTRRQKQYVVQANNTNVSCDLRYDIVKNIDLSKDIIIIPTKPVEYTISMGTPNVIIITPKTVPTENIIFTVMWNFTT